MRINNIIINGEVLGGFSRGDTKKKIFDERKQKSSRNIQKILVDAEIGNVNFFATDLNDFDIHFHGSAILSHDVIFDVEIIENQMKIIVKFNGCNISGNLILDIALPKKVYKEIFVTTNLGDVVLKNDVVVEKLRVKTMSGSIDSKAIINSISFDTMNGDANVLINARKDICLNMSTMNGTVDVVLNNIGSMDISTSTMNGRISKCTRKEGRHAIEGIISTMNGNINIR